MWQTRALELNNQEFWNWERACEVVDYASTHSFNTLVVGQVDLFDKLVSPIGYTPQQFNDRLSTQQRARCIYLNRLAKHCSQKGLAFYLQAKELSFQTDLLLSHPHLFDVRKDMRFDLAFWSQYLADKIALICQQIPALTGLLVALSNTDSLLPISTPNWLEGETPDSRNSEMIYRRCFAAMSDVMHRENKHLVLRVFPASNSDVANVMAAIAPLPESVSVSIKLTPERFWPEFPSNPALLDATGRDVWIDIDLAGEEVGWGNFPFMRIDELQGRLLWCRARNPAITGALCKISWEGVDNHWVINTLSECNLVSCSLMLAGNHSSLTTAQMLRYWLNQCYGWQPDDEVFCQFQQLLEQGKQALYSAIYARHHVFHRHSLLPESYGQAIWSLYGQLNRNHWLPGSGRDIHFSRDDIEGSSKNLSQIAKEKDDAYQAARIAREQALAFAREVDLPSALKQRWVQEWQGFALYCEVFVYAQKAFFTLHYARLVENNWSMREICRTNIQSLYSAAHEMEDFCQRHDDYSPGMYVMFDASRVRQLASSLTVELAKLMR